MVDLHIPKREDVPRKPLADLTVAWTNHAIPVYGAPLQPSAHMYPKDEAPMQTYTANPKAPETIDPRGPSATSRQARTPQPFSARPSASRSPLLAKTTKDASAHLDPNETIRFSTQGRPVGGVPPVLARSVTSNIFKKERAKTRATLNIKHANMSSKKASNNVASVLQPPEAPTSQPVQQGDGTGHSEGTIKRSQGDPVVNVLQGQDVPNTSSVDLSGCREAIRTKDPTEASLSHIIDDFSPDFFFDHTSAELIDVDMWSAASDDVMQVPFDDDFTYVFAPPGHDQDATRMAETQTGEYFWPIGQRVKSQKRGVENENGRASKKIRL